MTGLIIQQRRKTRAKRVASRAKICFAQEAGWRPVDKKKEVFDLRPIPKEHDYQDFRFLKDSSAIVG